MTELELTVAQDGPADVLDSQPPRQPLRRRQRLLIAGATALAVVAAVLGAGAYYAAGIPTPILHPLLSSTTLYYSDGTTVLARIGTVDRTVVAYDDLLPAVTQAAVAAEDPDFWSSGTGSITRSVARQATELAPGSSAAKTREFVAAWKLDDTYSKEEILAYFLNATHFGRQTAGIEAAARAYFHKSARRDAPPAEQLSAAEAMVLLALLGQPYPDPQDPGASPGFDPAASPAAAQNSRRRWAEIRDQFVALG